MFTIKVGTMPGKLQEVAVNEGMSAREIFELAEVTISNHEVRLDGEVINMNDELQGGKLLVAMKQIKGNARTIKVGTMPGKLQELEITGNETARELFEKAGITLSNHEIRLDGSVIDENTNINNGKLLVSMKQIKGNKDISIASYNEYVSNLDEEEIEILTGYKLPTTLNENEVDMIDDCVIINDVYLIENSIFFSIYELKEVETEPMNDAFMNGFKGILYAKEELEEVSIAHIEEDHVCTCKSAIEVIESKIRVIKEDLTYYDKVIDRKRTELYILQDVLKDIQ